MYNLSNSVETLINQLYELYDYARISHGVDSSYASTVTSILTDLKYVESNIKAITVTELNCNKYKSTISDLLVKYNDLEISGSNAEREEFFLEIIDKANDIISVLN